MIFPRYRKYKSCDVAGVQSLPHHWREAPLKYLVALQSGGTPSKENRDYWDGDVPWASAKDLKAESLNDTEDHITAKALREGGAALVPAGSALIVVRGMILAHTFPVATALRPMAINQDLKGVTARDGLSEDFLPWLLRGISDVTIAQVDEAGHGTKVLRIDA